MIRRILNNRRRRRIAAALLMAPVVLLIAYATFFCWRNARIEQEWKAWTSHLKGAPNSWTQPSNDYRRFDSSLTFKNRYGLTTAYKGYKDESGVVVIPPIFSVCGQDFREGLAWAYDPREERSGYINPDGSWAIVLANDQSTHSDFVGGMGEIQVIGADRIPMVGFVNREGVVVVPPRYHGASWYVDGYVLVYERTGIGRLLDRLFAGIDVGIQTPFDPFARRLLILDQEGRPATLPHR